MSYLLEAQAFFLIYFLPRFADAQPIPSMYGIFTYTCPIKNQPNVGKYGIHGWYGQRVLFKVIIWLTNLSCLILD